jgi:hypothetical protein
MSGPDAARRAGSPGTRRRSLSISPDLLAQGAQVTRQEHLSPAALPAVFINDELWRRAA